MAKIYLAIASCQPLLVRELQIMLLEILLGVGVSTSYFQTYAALKFIVPIGSTRHLKTWIYKLTLNSCPEIPVCMPLKKIIETPKADKEAIFS